ncbi:AmmeMemoRadiSam system protein A [Proteocatella sphenisci]|uniref:AmmeMemoRadiSam system protein A n=1 Tax=Proteocatella sphenisci TaxID=181070 RepID=UPI000491FF7A|nr:AmmeMemoRadiSam system protein A [Proteocatella sphenisci]
MKGYYLMPHPPLIMPEIGRGEEQKIESTVNACHEIGKRIKLIGADTVIIISPHGIVFRDATAVYNEPVIAGSFARFGAPLVEMSFQTDMILAEKILENARDASLPVAEINSETAVGYGISTDLDHGVMVPLHFIESSKLKIVNISYGLLSAEELYRFGMIVEKSVRDTGRNAVIIASGDLSHRLSHSGPYPYSPFGEEFDQRLIEIITEGDMHALINLKGKLVSEAGECGLRSLFILAGALDEKKVKGEVLSYEGPFGVGYAVVDFHFEEGASERHGLKIRTGDEYVSLARRSLDFYFKNNKKFIPQRKEWSELFSRRNGVFVSIKLEGALRGCIGTIAPTTDSVAQEIVQNAISAATQDPRFAPMTYEEFVRCDISVDVLLEAEPTSYEGLDPKKYGVIVSRGSRKGLLLPNLEGVDTVEYQLSIALRKAGIPENSDYKIERFEVIRHKEEKL